MGRFAGVLVLAAMCLPFSAVCAEQVHEGSWQFALQGGGAYQFNTALDDAGSFTVSRWFVQPSIGYAWNRRNSVSLSVGGGEDRYNFSDSTNVAGGKPWRILRNFRVSLPIRFAPTEALDVIIIPSLRTNIESGASLDKGRTEGALLGATWRFSPSFAIGPGIGVFSKLGGGVSVFPIIAIDWDITDRLNLSTGRGLAATRGPGLTLSWKATEEVRLGVSGRFETLRSRLNEDASSPLGIGEDRSFPLVASVEYRPWPAGSVSAFAGAELFGRLRVEDPDGNRIEEQNYDPAPILGAAFRARF